MLLLLIGPGHRPGSRLDERQQIGVDEFGMGGEQAVLQPPAAASLITSSEFASGSTFRRQVASCATAGQGGNRNDEGTRKKAPEN
jgi:hypothetical protein